MSLGLLNGVDLDGKPTQLLIEDGIIQHIGCKLPSRPIESIDLQGKLILPGLIDLHVHFREPGQTHKETIETGLQAAAAGGFTTVACMPNTNPPLDNAELVGQIKDKGKLIELIPIPAMTAGLRGRELTNFKELTATGALGISDDGKGVEDDQLMADIFVTAKKYGLLVMQHCEFSKLANRGILHQGERAQQLGVKGIPESSEYQMIARDLELLRKFGGRYHVLHLSCAKSLELVLEAKLEGLAVSCEVTPHHLLLNELDIPDDNIGMYKMNPPLRTFSDQQALIGGLARGDIDIIATDHAPHTLEEKGLPLEQAPFGIVGLETAFALLYTRLVLTNKISLRSLVEAMTTRPAHLFKLKRGELKVGARADITVIDCQREKEVIPEKFYSQGKNSPFGGQKLKGWPVLTFSRGKKVFDAFS